MSYSVANMVQRVRDCLLDNPWSTTLSSGYTANATTIAVPDGTRWDEGAVLEFANTGAQYWVVSVSVNNLTVIPNYNGTTSANQSSGDLIFRDPVFPYFRIKGQVEDQAVELWPYIYKKVTTTITPANGTYWYNLAATALGLIKVQQVDGTGKLLYEYGHRNSRLPVGFGINIPTSLVASGTGVYFPRGFANTTQNVQVDYAAKITSGITTGNYDDISDGILADCIANGAAATLLNLAENPRVTQEDVNMGDSSVQPGSRMRAGLAQQQTFIQLRNQYAEELRRTIPLMGEQKKPSQIAATGPYGSYTSAPPWG